MPSREVVLSNALGLHARASAKFVDTAKRFESEINVLAQGQTNAVDGKNIMALLLLEATCGIALTLDAEGVDADAALDALTELIKGNFGEIQDADSD
ncbi:MAG: HPr family phosphocarrier protein [Gammaproteobacteria bacterium]|nr:HPr family phosphocarrier protein [Gammaproteobacteria bacterium]MCY4198501.1 HPr family phosphocarrier protein [Gammaproteobacteria bacterium]MCY4276468.1 HPr family phosphocarrier protein [Gammaproteobacteria bacterium]MCY4322443.1 HPr family phosphocarrier protein [Gammaproteobacteria bacterium]